MKSLPIRLKVPIFLGLTLTIVIGSFLFVNNSYQSRTVGELYDSASDELRWAMARNVETLMMNGANDQIQPLFEELIKKGMVRRAVIVDAEKTIARSSDKTEIGGKSDDPLWDVLFRSQRDTLVETLLNGEPLVVGYRVFANTAGCADCHEGTVLGGMMMAKSEKAVKEQLASNSMMMILLGIMGGLVMICGFVLVLNKSIFKPLEAVQVKLRKAAQGDVNQDIKVRSEDEIGRLLTSIRDLIAYMRDLSSAAEKVAAGDLRVTIAQRGEQDVLGKAFGRMVSNLESIVKDLSDNSDKLAAASSQIAASAEQMSHGADKQAQQISQVSTAMEEMAATIVESSRNAGEASDTAQNANDTAESGGQVVADTIEGMHKIAEVVKGSSSSIEALANAAEQIGAIVEVIDDIASQTNLLALNAAIEAARAGEQGRGFAVVADEVRKLAERSGKATGEITGMVKSIQARTKEAVGSMDAGIGEVDRGRELADIAGNSLREIVAQSQRVVAVIKQLAGASEEQSVAAEQISKNIEQISAVTKETATGAGQSAIAAETLSHQAESLKKIVGRFQLRT